MCSSLHEQPAELRALVEALLSRRKFFRLKARLLKGVQCELRAAKESGLTWLVIWSALRDAGYPGAYPNFCRTSAALLQESQTRPTKDSKNLPPPSAEKEVHQPIARELDRGPENKEKPAWQIQREETMARLDREAELNRQREAQWQPKKVFKPSGSRWTSPYFERYISLAVSTGVRLMLIYLMLGVFRTVSNNWIATMNGYTADQPITQIFPTLMSMLLFAFASWMIPKMAASIASGTLGTGAADLVGIGAEIGKGAALGAATVAAVVATGGAGAVAGGALAATETAGAMEGAGAATTAASAVGDMGAGATDAAGAPAPPAPSSEANGSPDSPPAPAPPDSSEVSGTTPDAPPAPDSAARTAQSLARQADNIDIPHDGSGHAPSAQLRIDREE
jgi:hypothetical protein